MVALGGLAAYGGSRLPPVPGQQVGPNVFPMVVGIGLVICGGMIALRVGRSFEDEAEADLAKISSGEEVAASKAATWTTGLRVLLPPAMLIFYVYAVERLGFLPTAATIVFTIATALGARLILAIPLALGAPLFVNLVFLKLLRVPLPSGLLPLPWLGLP